MVFSLSAVYQNHYNYWTYRRSLTSSNYYSTLENGYTFNDYLPTKKSEKNISVLKTNITSPIRKVQTNNSITFKFDTKKNQIISLPVVMYAGKKYDIWVNNHKSQSFSSSLLKIKAKKGSNTVKIVSVENNNKLLLFFSISSFIAFSMYLAFVNHQISFDDKIKTSK